MTESRSGGLTKGQEGNAQVVEVGPGNLERVQGHCPVVQGWFRKAKIQLQLKLARDVKNNNDFLQICQPEKTGQRKPTKLATVQEEKTDITLPQSLMATFLPVSLEWIGCKASTAGSKVLLTLREDQVCDSLRNVNVHQSMRPYEIGSKSHEGLGNGVAKPLRKVMAEKSDKSPGTWKKEDIAPILKTG